MSFAVYDEDSNDVTYEKDWYIRRDGILFYMAEDNTLVEAVDHWYTLS